ncbi:MAG: zinc metallopeptidase [Hoeflea sp.]|uniref:KPN_02809 family neutral zinc metallopeptidase n=1 Tax=Hoeflea sp. TaxID=1940281 RepID=UPI001D948F6B|nr:neutral zinc metallopeptidase [Hoeflea sp.]MBU4527172.1 zinc metallopeptidase [Alphaproteobacteria bacterium]MBU4544811.1 zinc metallopeptidase [Alphaproteobacteria bacterium]MBU4551443.1 zinc metallopeptidase [Alphaproteobacteria bacterium]MBV1725448.1 zinc metallopeptidase [Hoeflea sp.]MBV1759496.1 zinc metallopeptidase [Hoeflea sp.]
MDWKGRRQSDNIEDRRGQSSRGGNPFGRGGMRLPTGGMRGGGGLSLKAVLIIGVIYLGLKLIGIDPLQILGGGDPGGQLTSERQVSPARQDEMTQFVATVLAETEDVWNGIMQSQGFEYPEPTLVLFSGAVSSACGNASAASGPFYCPGDQKVYIDLTFFDELAKRFKASGDFAQAYVLAHEVGHHVQNLIGVLPQFNEMRRSMSQTEQNQMSIRVELQADCFAGIWGHYTAQKGLLESGDLEEALNAAQQIGDDTIQRRTQGYVVPESFNHGTAAQRKEWFSRGFDTGRLEACDTFNNPV